MFALCADDVSHQAIPANPADGKPMVTSGPTFLVRFLAWIYLVLSTIAGLVLLGIFMVSVPTPGLLGVWGLATIAQGGLVWSLLLILSRLSDNVAIIIGILGNGRHLQGPEER